MKLKKINAYIKALKVLQIPYCVNYSAKKSTFEWEHAVGVREKTVFRWLHSTEEAVTFSRQLKPVRRARRERLCQNISLKSCGKKTKKRHSKSFNKSELTPAWSLLQNTILLLFYKSQSCTHFLSRCFSCSNTFMTTDTRKQYKLSERNQHLQLLCPWVQNKVVELREMYCGI